MSIEENSKKELEQSKTPPSTPKPVDDLSDMELEDVAGGMADTITTTWTRS